MIMTSFCRIKLLVGLFLTCLLYASCVSESTSNVSNELFNRVTSNYTGIDFQNKLIETESANYYKYMYSYIGGGVGAADFNNDGLEDLFFVSNTFDNKLYLNQGDLKFKDVSIEAGIIKRKGFDAGVSVVDINNDGFLDIYITRGGWEDSDNAFANMLYVNNGLSANGKSISFTERAKEYGLDENNRSIQASFFDYDKDGDIDVYISNTPDFESRDAIVVDLIEARTDPRTIALKGSDKLYNNDGQGHFTDVSIVSGIYPDIGFGLNPQVGDLNNDGWLDIYVCNDFRIPDFAYINNGDGTFREGRNELFKHISFNSMGADIADINNDGLSDLLTLDMNPADYIRSKTTMAMTSLDLFETMVNSDYHHQYMHNMLQVNNGTGSYSEISNMAGVANSDWSWASLMADFDLDGYNDIFITNGVYRDVIDRDKNNEILKELRAKGKKPTDADFLRFAQELPQQKLNNFFFRNRGDLTFEDVSNHWMDSIPSFSNGAVYTDLDNDGDLDVVVNNINEGATILKNNSIDNHLGNYLSIELNGPEKNLEGLGAIVNLSYSDGRIQTRQLVNSRGFLSSVSNRLHFGVSKEDSIVNLEVNWLDGLTQKIKDVRTNQLLVLSHSEARKSDLVSDSKSTQLLTQRKSAFKHIDPSYNDYSQQILLPHKLSQTGPAVAKADVNGDGLEDIYLGGGRSYAGELLLAKSNGDFEKKRVVAFDKDKEREDVSACFFDADGDGDSDLYVVSGSYEYRPTSKMLVDRLYFNDGKGNFTKQLNKMPEIPSAGSVVVSADFDKDGDLDLFVGGRVIPSSYPFPPKSYLLINDKGTFTDRSEELAPGLSDIGMVTDASWSDIDGNGELDLIVTGEWMGIEVFVNLNGRLKRVEDYPNLLNAKGWWNKIVVADVDMDGDEDIIAGNLGLNTKYHATTEKPFHVYTSDFDYNGTTDVILAKQYKGVEVPVRGKSCTAQQIPHLANKIPTYNEFANSDLNAILGPGLKSALHYEATEFRSGIFINEGNQFKFSAFGNEVQQSPINSILYDKIDGDNIPDLLLAGNNYMPEIETTRYDAGIGVLLKGSNGGAFQLIPHYDSGFNASKDVRHLIKVNNKIFVINNNDTHDIFELPADKEL